MSYRELEALYAAYLKDTHLSVYSKRFPQDHRAMWEEAGIQFIQISVSEGWKSITDEDIKEKREKLKTIRQLDTECKLLHQSKLTNGIYFIGIFTRNYEATMKTPSKKNKQQQQSTKNNNIDAQQHTLPVPISISSPKPPSSNSIPPPTPSRSLPSNM